MSTRSRQRFNFAHSVAGIALLLGIEAFVAVLLRGLSGGAEASIFAVLAGATAGGIGIVIIATEVIREVRKASHMLALLSATVFEFIAFFAFQYLFFSLAAPGSFGALPLDPVSLVLHSTMIFALNPLYLPVSPAGEGLLLINTLESLVLAFFVLQNIWQFRDGEVERQGDSWGNQ